MTIKQQPFTRYHEKKQRDVVPVSLNKLERLKLDQWKEALEIPFDSTTLKILARIGANVILGQIPSKDLKYLLSRERKRLGESMMGFNEPISDDSNVLNENL